MSRLSDGEGDEEDSDLDSFNFDQEALDHIDALEAERHGEKSAQSNALQKDQYELLDDMDEWDDSAFLNELAQVEGAHNKQHAVTSIQQESAAGPSSRRIMHSPPPHPSSSSSSVAQKARKPQQRNLFGEMVVPQASQGLLLVANKAHTAKATASQKIRQAAFVNRFDPAQKAMRKEWNRSQPLNAVKSKSSYNGTQDDDFEIELGLHDDPIDIGDDDFMKAPPLPLPEGLQQMKVAIDRAAAATWIYPTNKEKRDYQFNIVQRALFNNVLVALPTGLGKTFIAAVVILNYYRWFPEGKIIFVAPTKPLVAQQQQACHGICGLPWDCAVEMTGGTKASLRGDEWKTKRIFYMTPQTFENDLCSTAVDAKDVVCVVVDEAHRATGNYAYGKVIRWITARNPFFRVLALTATPGNKSEKVQEVIDNLHINMIEIRTEEAVDIRKYVHTKREDPVVVPLGGVVAQMRDQFAKLMRPHMEVLSKNGLMGMRDPCSLPPYAVQAINIDAHKRRIVQERKLYPHLGDLGAMARAMEILLRYSVQMFFEKISSLQSGIDLKGKKASTNRQRSKFLKNTIIQDIEGIYHKAEDSNGKVRHPKMEYLQNVVAAHFASEEEQDQRENTRIMIFCHFRECVLEIVDILNEQHGIKAVQFVGQSTDTKGNKGMRQKEQEKIVQDFKNGDYNVLVATSIGEEGLDIGEVDLIICYEAVKNSVRMLQRIGRTGRKRDGRIVILMAEGSEENFWQHSKDNHKIIQNDILNGSHLELFDDVERLVPNDITSTVVHQDVDQPPFEPSMIRQPGARQKKASKVKHNSDPHRNIPSDGLKGFVKVSDLRKKKKKKARVSMREGESQSPPAPQPQSSSDNEEAAPKPRSICFSDDSDDERLERGITIKSNKPAPVLVSSSAESSQSSIGRRKGGRLGAGRPAPIKATPSSPPDVESISASASSRVALTDSLLSSSSVLPTGRSAVQPLQARRIDDAPESPSLDAASRHEMIAVHAISSPTVKKSVRKPHRLLAKLVAEITDGSSSSTDEAEDNGKEVLLSLDSPLPAKRKRFDTVRRKPIRLPPSSSPLMGPPALPASSKKGKGNGKGKALHKGSRNDSEVRIRKRKRTIGGSPTSRRLFQYEADRSTDEEIHCEMDENDDGQDTDEADSSDREHVGDFAPTQAPVGYRQDAVYLQSLMSQSAATPFRRPPRVAAFSGYQMGVDAEQVSHRVRDTPRRPGSDSEEDDEYEVGSFVCSDEEVVYESSQQSASQL